MQPGTHAVTVHRMRKTGGGFSYVIISTTKERSTPKKPERYEGKAIPFKRRWDRYKTEAEALEAATALAKRQDELGSIAHNLTPAQALEYATASDRLKEFGVTVDEASGKVAECLRLVSGLTNISAACQFYQRHHRQVERKPVSEVVAAFLKDREGSGKSARYLRDLHWRLGRFAEDCRKDMSAVTTKDVQGWLDAQKLGNRPNYRAVLSALFNFGLRRGWAMDNPVEGTEVVKVRFSETEVFTPVEIARLLEAARTTAPNFQPCLAIGAFAGLRSAEIERLEWSDIHLPERFIVVGANKAKTATRRVVPIHDNLAEWLTPYSQQQGKVWSGTGDEFYDMQQAVAAATAVAADEKKGIKPMKAVKWKQNALRHSYASYRFALTNDAGRVAGELGNSPGTVHKHYRELVRPKDAERWFAIKPERPDNLVTMQTVSERGLR